MLEAAARVQWLGEYNIMNIEHKFSKRSNAAMLLLQLDSVEKCKSKRKAIERSILV